VSQSLGTPGENFNARGNWIFDQTSLPAGSVGNASADAADPFEPDKSVQQHTIPYAEARASSPAAKRIALRRALAAGTIEDFTCGLSDSNSTGTVTIDLLKNGATVLSATITLNSTPGTGGTDFDDISAGIASPNYVAGDWLEANITVSAPDGKGLLVQLTVNEQPF